MSQTNLLFKEKSYEQRPHNPVRAISAEKRYQQRSIGCKVDLDDKLHLLELVVEKLGSLVEQINS